MVVEGAHILKHQPAQAAPDLQPLAAGKKGEGALRLPFSRQNSLVGVGLCSSEGPGQVCSTASNAVAVCSSDQDQDLNVVILSELRTKSMAAVAGPTNLAPQPGSALHDGDDVSKIDLVLPSTQQDTRDDGTTPAASLPGGQVGHGKLKGKRAASVAAVSTEEEDDVRWSKAPAFPSYPRLSAEQAWSTRRFERRISHHGDLQHPLF